MNGEDEEGYELLMKDIDAIAQQLLILQEADVPILWRPLHEASGGWFWWGASGAEAYKQLYILLYDKLTNEYGLNNLIWLWNGQDADWYPGDEYVDGDELGKRISFPESLGALIENPGFIEHYSALDNMRAIASIKGIASENEMREILQEVGLDPDEKKSVKKYSLGMRQKLGIAIALMEKPEMILLDEPFNALDEKSVEKVKSIIRQRAAEGALMGIHLPGY